MRARKRQKDARVVTHKSDESPKTAKEARVVTHESDESPKTALRWQSGHS
ncbi:hypothetical protein [Neobacillus niacini]